MNSSKRYYRNLDIIRLCACFAILLYHFNILKGGYLAVCSFFVLSGYLSCISAFKKEKFSFLSYYSNRLLKLYLPLVLVVFITIFFVSLLPDISWFNLKSETTSVLFGYNNFWQLSANLDYFARHINSPFIHLWYISILLQFDLIFPFIYLLFRKIGDKINKILPCLITFLLSVAFSIYFCKASLTQNLMIVYYDTFTRIFSLLFGVSLGFIHSYYGPSVLKMKKSDLINKIIFYAYLALLVCLFILIDAKSIYFSSSMIAVTIITCRLIDYGTISVKESVSICDKILKFLAKISYEIYLLQYPIIFLFQYVNTDEYLKMPIMIILILVLSYILHFCIHFKGKNIKSKVLHHIVYIIILSISCLGAYQYYISKNYTLEMKKLEEQLAKNEKLMQKKQEEYASYLEQENNNWMLTLEDLQNGEKELESIVHNLQITGVGDSVMLGAIENLYQEFPNSYFDARISRTAWVANGILQNLKNRNLLGNPVVLNLGANGDCPESCKREIMKTCEGHEVFWLNVTNDKDVYVNHKLSSLAASYNNLHIIDWNSISKGHPEYFVADGIHLTEIGKQVYTRVIYDAIYQMYLDQYTKKKEEIIRQHDEEHKMKISFYGNSLLLNAFDYIQTDFPRAKFIINKEFNYEALKKEVKNALENDSLTYRIVFAFDDTMQLGSKEYQDLIELCSGHEIYILSTSEQSINSEYENVTIINFYQEIKSSKEYLMKDGIHLTDKGNVALSKVLNDALN